MRLRLTVLLLLVLTAWALSASARSAGGPASGWADSVKSNDGCTCHGTANPATVINDVEGWPSSYVPGQQYILTVSSTNNVQRKPQLEENQGGFMAWVSKGDIATTPGTQAWVHVGVLSSGEQFAAHNIQGETENGKQEWSFTWTAPEAGSGSVELRVYVNRINSDQSNGGDHWNKKVFTATEGSGTPTSVFPTPSHTPVTESQSTPAHMDGESTAPASSGVGGQSEPGPGFAIGAVVVVLSAIIARRRIR